MSYHAFPVPPKTIDDRRDPDAELPPMKIEFGRNIEDVDSLREILRQKFKIKFVMIQTATTERIAKLFSVTCDYDRVTSQLLDKNKGSTFVGAGVIKKHLNVSWDSGSRPAKNADEIAEELKHAILQLIGEE